MTRWRCGMRRELRFCTRARGVLACRVQHTLKQGTAAPVSPAASWLAAECPPQRLPDSIPLFVVPDLTHRRLLADAKKAKRDKKEQLVKIMEQASGREWRSWCAVGFPGCMCWWLLAAAVVAHTITEGGHSVALT